MANKQGIIGNAELKELMAGNADFLKPLVQQVVQDVLESEMEDLLQAARHERAQGRTGYRSGHYSRGLVTRVGKIELQVPQDRQGRFSTQVFERYQRSEKAFVTALSEMYIQGVSTRKVTKITEELCGHEVSASTISTLNRRLDAQLQLFANRPLDQEYPYLILDARYEKVREDGVIRSRAVLVAIGINWDGRREVLGVELANRESRSSWRDFLIGLKKRGLHGVDLAISDSHEGLKRAIAEVLPESCWQRCYVHFLRNALDYLSRKADPDCLTELRWLYDRRNLEEARKDLQNWLAKWQARYPKLCEWAESNIEETFTFYRYPPAHHKHLKSTNMLERINEELKRRTHVIRIFPNAHSCQRLLRALCVEIHEGWIEQHRYLNMELLKEHRKARLEVKAA